MTKLQLMGLLHSFVTDYDEAEGASARGSLLSAVADRILNNKPNMTEEQARHMLEMKKELPTQ